MLFPKKITQHIPRPRPAHWRRSHVSSLLSASSENNTSQPQTQKRGTVFSRPRRCATPNGGTATTIKKGQKTHSEVGRSRLLVSVKLAVSFTRNIISKLFACLLYLLLKEFVSCPIITVQSLSELMNAITINNVERTLQRHLWLKRLLYRPVLQLNIVLWCF